MITPPRRLDFPHLLFPDSLAAPVRRAARFAGALALAVPFAQGEPDAVRMDFGLQATLRTGASDGMNWVGFHGGWGEPLRAGKRLPSEGFTVNPSGARAAWSDGVLRVEVVRGPAPGGDGLEERYVFRNLGDAPLRLAPGELALRLPLADDYKSGAKVCLTSRCHAHLWAEGSGAWVCAWRMNGRAPHLGLVLTQGQMDGYSIVEREWNSNDRGVFAVHPALTELPPKGEYALTWRLFSHTGWGDFFRRAAVADPGFIRMQADDLVVPLGKPLRITATCARPLSGATVLVNGRATPCTVEAGRLTCAFTPSQPGEQRVELRFGERRERLSALVTPPLESILRARADFLMDRKQVLDPASPHDGAYAVLDLDTGRRITDTGNADHNTARERLGSGVFLGLLWRSTPDGAYRERLKSSFLRHYAFVNRELRRPDGTVINGVKDAAVRLYNYPWVIREDLCAWRITRDPACLRRLMESLRNLYDKRDGAHFYMICMPISETVTVLREAGMTAEADEALSMFRRHADEIIRRGIDIPRHEVAYEQSIMAPALQIVAETGLVTGDPKYRRAADLFLPMTEAFGGRQPDHRLYDIGIRHWDGYWFGKPRPDGRLYGDVMPHYWSTITAEAFRYYAALANSPDHLARARRIILANFSQYDASGAGHCAYLYPRSVNGVPGRYQDPYDNDQDWTLVHHLLLESMQPASGR